MGIFYHMTSLHIIFSSTKALPYVEQQVVACDDLSQCTDHHNYVFKDLSKDQTSDLITFFVTVYLCIFKPFEYSILNYKPSKCKRTLQSSLDNLVWVSIIQLVLGSSEPAIHSSLPSCSRCHSLYYVALLDMVVISILIWVPIVTSTQTKLVQYIQLV